jgi:hypothetical protein
MIEVVAFQMTAMGRMQSFERILNERQEWRLSHPKADGPLSDNVDPPPRFEAATVGRPFESGTADQKDCVIIPMSRLRM